jgi:GxxExxY protein
MFEEDKLTHKIIGCAMNVHNAIGCGFQEVIYYQGEMVGTRRIDFLVEGSVIVELKALKELEDVHLVQGKNYLKVFNIEKGLLLNLGATSLEFKRLFK